ncbi:GtrA family protein [Thiomicrorhabdus arctica]|uniref:GtrA family protein n=1 Tax=Thiomicrorhabdus arctica TaxID=131540 RepID=UPI0003638A52|nr:GtrA family protein [Thiomicrorhabdus arctica]
MKIALMYTIFAIFATVANIAGQDLSIRLYQGSFAITLSIFVGTGVGLVLKYWLDKRYIFQYQTVSIQHGSKTFYLYTVMGLITTVIFWGFEFTFDAIYQTKEMRYIGGIIGLAIGYYVKYQLDKKYVFK